MPPSNVNCLLQRFVLPHPKFDITYDWIIEVSENYLDRSLADWVQGTSPSGLPWTSGKADAA